MNGEHTKPVEVRSEDRRCARIYPDPQSWLLELPEEWDSMTEDERHDYIREAALDNCKGGFKYEEIPR